MIYFSTAVALVPGFLCTNFGIRGIPYWIPYRIQLDLYGSVFFDKHPAQPSNNFPWTILINPPQMAIPSYRQPGYFTVRFLPSGDGKCVHRFVSSKGAMEPCDPLT